MVEVWVWKVLGLKSLGLICPSTLPSSCLCKKISKFNETDYRNGVCWGIIWFDHILINIWHMFWPWGHLSCSPLLWDSHIFTCHIHSHGREHMAGEHMVGTLHVTHISRSQIKFILLLPKLSICLPRECSGKRLQIANPIVPSERSRPLPASSAAHGRWCCTLLWYCWSSLCSNLETTFQFGS
jgi:hypothetical protein